jgi:hypothetical protein
MPRGYSTISRISDEESGYEVEKADNLSPWMNYLANRLNGSKQDVTPSTPINQQVSSYVNSKKPIYATVNDAVEDYKQRTGLAKYLDSIKQANKKSPKELVMEIKASCEIPKTLLKFDCADEIVSFVKNLIKNNNGLGCSVPQLQYDILSTFSPSKCPISEQDLNESDVIEFLNECIAEERKSVPKDMTQMNLGLGLGKDVEDQRQEEFFSSDLYK